MHHLLAVFPSRYIVGEDGLRRLQTVRLDDKRVASDRVGPNATPNDNHGGELTPTNDVEAITD